MSVTNNNRSSAGGCVTFVVIGVIALIALLTNHSNETSGGVPVPTPTPTVFFDKTEQPAPGSGTVFMFSEADCTVGLTITTRAQGYNFLLFLDKSTHKKIMGVFLCPGTTVHVQVPSGDFVLQCASGAKWYGIGAYFGPETAFSKMTNAGRGTDVEGQSGDDFIFSRGYAYSLTLIGQVNGNVGEVPLSAAEFGK